MSRNLAQKAVAGCSAALLLLAALPSCKRTAPPTARGAPAGSAPASASAAHTAPPAAFRELAAIFPEEAEGYRPDGPDGFYDRRNLFDLINGGAEVFLALNVRAVASRHYARADSPELLVDIFDMGSSSDAYGAYHHDMREGESADIGNESELGRTSLFFWKGRYYVSVVAFADTAKSRIAVATMGRAVASRIEQPGEMPDLVGLLPPAGVVASQIHYFHTWDLLSRHYPFGEQDLLGLGGDTEGILARYRGGDAAAFSTLLVVRYPSADRAERAERRFVEAYLPDAGAGIGERSGAWAGLRRLDNLLVGVFDAPSAGQAGALLTAIEHQRKR